MRKCPALGIAVLMVLPVMVGVAAASDPQGEGVQKLRPSGTANPILMNRKLINLPSDSYKVLKVDSWVICSLELFIRNWYIHDCDDIQN